MSQLYELQSSPDLDSPVLLVALDGWIDAGFAGSAALTTIAADTEKVVIAVFDSDELLDHRARRPTMHIDNGVDTGLTWPGIELWATTDLDGNDALVLSGAEPDHRWRAFSSAVADLALDFGARMVTSLGAYPAPAPHTRPTRVVATATTVDLARQVGFLPDRIDVPAGVSSAIQERVHEVGLPALGLWAQVPHYAAAMPYPAASLALIEMLATVTGLRFAGGSLADEGRATRQRLDELVSNSPEHLELVHQLEVQVDNIAEGTITTVSGDELAAELERFLRDQGSN